MICFNFESECYSCGVCKFICPWNAISFEKNLLPVVDFQKCVECGLCEKRCLNLNQKAVVSSSSELEQKSMAFIAKSKNIKIRKQSSSGGIFFHIAENSLAKGELVCGCIYDKNFMPKHILSDNLSDVEKMMGSKYVQSNVADCLDDLYRNLRSGRNVVFTGVPCQTAAISELFKEYREQVLLVSLVCHGSIAPRFWRFYLEEEGKRGKITKITMREKSKGWLNYGLGFKFKDGTSHLTYRNEDGNLLQCFTDGLFERDRCLKCVYKGDEIKADIILGDAWGMDKEFPDFVDDYGVSVVVCRTEKGRKLLETMDNLIDRKKVSMESVIKKNPRIISPEEKNYRSDFFQKEIQKKPHKIIELCQKYGSLSLKNRIINKAFKTFRK